MILTQKKNDCDMISNSASTLLNKYLGIILKIKKTPQNNNPLDTQNFGSSIILFLSGDIIFP